METNMRMLPRNLWRWGGSNLRFSILLITVTLCSYFGADAGWGQSTTSAQAQNSAFDRLAFLLGRWQGTGSGFGNAQSSIESEFRLIMEGKYMEARNEANFVPTASKPEGEHHVDWGIISFDKNREKIVYREFNSEGFVNQYVLNTTLSSDTTLVFETEAIESFVDGGKARYTIKKTGPDQIETVFDLSFPGKDFVCYGTNRLTRR